MKARPPGLLLVSVALVFGGSPALLMSERATRHGQRPEAFIPGVPTVVQTPVTLLRAISIPGNPLVSTDLLWVDQASERLFVADRSNFGVDIIDAENDTFVSRATGFVGPTGPAGGGPNGLLVTPDNKL